MSLPLSAAWSAFVDAVEAGCLRALRALLCRLSWRRVDQFAAALGSGFHVAVFTRRAVAIRNVRVVFGNELSFADADRIARRANIRFVQSMCQFLRITALTAEEFQQRVKLVGLEHYERATARGRGVIILTAHLGNWEFLGARLARAGVPLTGLARDRSNGTVDRIMRETREAAGTTVLPQGATMLTIARMLQRNEAFAILVDQHAAFQGVPLPFFGRVTPMHPVVARLARQTGAAVLPCYCTRCGDEEYVTTIYPELELAVTDDKHADIVENTRRTTRMLEAQIRLHPDEWLWVHKRWRDNDDYFVEWAKNARAARTRPAHAAMASEG